MCCENHLRRVSFPRKRGRSASCVAMRSCAQRSVGRIGRSESASARMICPPPRDCAYTRPGMVLNQMRNIRRQCERYGFEPSSNT